VQGRADRTAALLADPLALGTIGALLLGFIAAALVAILGFALSAAITARERQAEFALLRALGLHPRQLVASLSLEQGITVALSLIGGLLLGLLLARLVLPLVSLTQAGVAAVPSTRVIVPWLTIILLVGGVLVALVGVGAILGMVLRRTGLGGALRVAEE
jgi:ABC-type antimicrobial peptide transport system permease subunit